MILGLWLHCLEQSCKITLKFVLYQKARTIPYKYEFLSIYDKKLDYKNK